MLNLKKFLSGSLLAVALGACAGVFAAPVYHVTIDTSTLGNSNAVLDLELGALTGNAAPVTATLNHFMGAYGASDFSGSASGAIGSSVRLVNDAGYSGLLQSIILGGLFSFDLSFDVGTGGLDGSSFTAMLYNADFSATLGMDTPLVQIDLMPGQADVVSPANAFASATAVPEPSTLLSMVTGLGLLGFGLRRRAR
ncbi:NF038129 family PEP-CTERM protein [Herbaspirillum sp. SJZ107]|uniref:NF038129 family PEP-CTERM protein n=1 Tax=Herbaspirillum sp. SJZ107 TaxID=2572881 RepID=UPI00114FEAF3|nr:NF038129 family PEP-CTERM protein [Herbaspirillum sp. SJZ107]TQK07949.1 putative secreted protein with PEP-CTERM sorting signal [Herbaspirillum sp. SJZ107]